MNRSEYVRNASEKKHCIALVSTSVLARSSKALVTRSDALVSTALHLERWNSPAKMFMKRGQLSKTTQVLAVPGRVHALCRCALVCDTIQHSFVEACWPQKDRSTTRRTSGWEHRSTFGAASLSSMTAARLNTVLLPGEWVGHRP